MTKRTIISPIDTIPTIHYNQPKTQYQHQTHRRHNTNEDKQKHHINNPNTQYQQMHTHKIPEDTITVTRDKTNKHSQPDNKGLRMSLLECLCSNVFARERRSTWRGLHYSLVFRCSLYDAPYMCSACYNGRVAPFGDRKSMFL